MFMNERNSGAAHITAALEAFAKSAIISQGNFVFDFENKLGISITPANGEVSIMSGVMNWGGRMAGIRNTENVSYTPPNSETLFKKVIVCAKYSKNTETLIESIQLDVLESENQPSESAANALTIDTGSGEITTATETAYFPLWSFIATSVSVTTPVQLFTVVSGIAQLNDILNTVNKALTQEIADRKSAINNETKNRENSVYVIENKLAATNYNVSANTAAIQDLKKKYELIARNSSGIDSYTVERPITDFSMILVKCNAGTNSKIKYLTIPAFKIGDTGSDSNDYSVSEYTQVVSEKTIGYDIAVHAITIKVYVYYNKFTVKKEGSSTTKMIEIVGIY